MFCGFYVFTIVFYVKGLISIVILAMVLVFFTPLICVTVFLSSIFYRVNKARLLDDQADVCNSQGKYEEAQRLYEQTRDIRNKVLGPKHPDTARSLNGLADVYNGQGKYVEAEQQYKETLVICEKALGPKHPDTARSLNGVALLLTRPQTGNT